MSVFSERISFLRKRAGLKQREVCELLGNSLSPQVLSSYENGKREPDFERVVNLAKIYQVSTEYLLGASEHENPANVDITERLGLYTQAINSLEWYNINFPEYANIFNELFCGVLFMSPLWNLLGGIYKYCEMKKEYNKLNRTDDEYLMLHPEITMTREKRPQANSNWYGVELTDADTEALTKINEFWSSGLNNESLFDLSLSKLQTDAADLVKYVIEQIERKEAPDNGEH